MSDTCKLDIKWDYCSEDWTGGFSGGVTLFGKLKLRCKVTLPRPRYLGTAQLTLSEDDGFSLQVLPYIVLFRSCLAFSLMPSNFSVKCQFDPTDA